MGKFFKEKILRFFMQKCPLFWSKLDIFPVFCEILQNPPLFEKIPQFPVLKNLSLLLGQKSHKTGKFPPFGHTVWTGCSGRYPAASLSVRSVLIRAASLSELLSFFKSTIKIDSEKILNLGICLYNKNY